MAGLDRAAKGHHGDVASLGRLVEIQHRGRFAHATPAHQIGRAQTAAAREMAGYGLLPPTVPRNLDSHVMPPILFRSCGLSKMFVVGPK